MQLNLNHVSVGRYVYTLNITTNLGPFFILQSYGYTHRERVLSPKSHVSDGEGQAFIGANGRSEMGVSESDVWPEPCL